MKSPEERQEGKTQYKSTFGQLVDKKVDIVEQDGIMSEVTQEEYVTFWSIVVFEESRVLGIITASEELYAVGIITFHVYVTLEHRCL